MIKLLHVKVIYLIFLLQQIRIRDPNQGGRDITEEIMSGGRSATTPTPPQVQKLLVPLSFNRLNKC